MTVSEENLQFFFAVLCCITNDELMTPLKIVSCN